MMAFNGFLNYSDYLSFRQHSLSSLKGNFSNWPLTALLMTALMVLTLFEIKVLLYQLCISYSRKWPHVVTGAVSDSRLVSTYSSFDCINIFYINMWSPWT